MQPMISAQYSSISIQLGQGQYSYIIGLQTSIKTIDGKIKSITHSESVLDCIM